MEEGKRMFSIFAARMFEQRVLTAYREKVAQERQLQLLRELEEEDKSTRDREMKKQTQNQKKKDKKRYAVFLSPTLQGLIILLWHLGCRNWRRKRKRRPSLQKRPLRKLH